jgi:hypothetical protein
MFDFDSWAQPVTSKPWAVVAAIAFRLSKASGYRVLNHFKGGAHRKACGFSWA